MKKYAAILGCLLGLIGTSQAQIQLNIDAGVLAKTSVTTPVPVGGLLQLIASPSGTFSSSTSSSYTSGDNVLVASFAMDYNSGTTGETINNLLKLPLVSTTAAYSAANGYTTGIYVIAAGEKVQLRFFPDLTFSTTTNYTNTAPTLGTSYGSVRSDTVEFGPTGGDSAETTWIIPASGTVDLDYDTIAAGGTYANNTAFANSTVAAVPEPSTYGAIGGALMSLMSVRAWKRRRMELSKAV